MIFKSKIGKGIVLFISIILGLVIYNLIMAKVWQPIGMIVILIAFISYIFISIYYQIENNILIIKTGIFGSTRIDINSITRIKETYNPLSAPALSLDRLEIKYGKYKWALISPKEKELFISEILKINPKIEIRRRQNQNPNSILKKLL